MLFGIGTTNHFDKVPTKPSQAKPIFDWSIIMIGPCDKRFKWIMIFFVFSYMGGDVGGN
jgi:hypothetical protein